MFPNSKSLLGIFHSHDADFSTRIDHNGFIIGGNNASSSNFVSACLMAKGDTKLLNEWIAYHYHTLRLRHLILANHPANLTTLNSHVWSQLGLRIEVWSNRQTSRRSMQNAKINTTTGDSTNQYQAIYPSSTFFRKCLKSLRHEGRNWILLVDEFEFVVLHPKLRNRRRMGRNTVPLKLTSDALYNFLLEATEFFPKSLHYPCVSLPRNHAISGNRTTIPHNR